MKNDTSKQSTETTKTEIESAKRTVRTMKIKSSVKAGAASHMCD